MFSVHSNQHLLSFICWWAGESPPRVGEAEQREMCFSPPPSPPTHFYRTAYVSADDCVSQVLPQRIWGLSLRNWQQDTHHLSLGEGTWHGGAACLHTELPECKTCMWQRARAWPVCTWGTAGARGIRLNPSTRSPRKQKGWRKIREASEILFLFPFQPAGKDVIPEKGKKRADADKPGGGV